ncbi:DUF4097 domain-containing protein [Micromonospora sp. NPDC000089]|uniref:DUF4097 family beta strand repeat-containing protein n=1 Tax=unclassified Micromonospora TaxID=2617518 RepID=UPI0036BD043E
MALPRTAVALGAAATLILTAGCDTLSTRRLDFDTTESVAIKRVTVRPGAGDVTVRATGPATEVHVKRVLRYQGDQPDTTYTVSGDELVLNTDCGFRCSVSYEVTAPPGVRVGGETGSGDVELAGTGPVEFKLGSGDLRILGATGAVRAETGSGNITVDGVAAPVELHTGSGDITGVRLGGEVAAQAGSGDVTVELDKPASARAHADSGDVRLVVPTGRYRVRSSTGSGDARLGVTDDPSATVLLDVGAGSGNVEVSAR